MPPYVAEIKSGTSLDEGFGQGKGLNNGLDDATRERCEAGDEVLLFKEGRDLREIQEMQGIKG